MSRETASAKEDTQEDPQSTQLLADIRAILTEDRISSHDLAKALADLKDRPWCRLNDGLPMTKNGLSKLLKPIGIKSRTIRLTCGKTLKGYLAKQFNGAWSRHLPNQNVTTSQACNISNLSSRKNVTDLPLVTDAGKSEPLPSQQCDVIAFPTGRNIREEKEGQSGCQIKVLARAWLEGGELHLRGTFPDLAAEIALLTGEDLSLQKELLSTHCPSHSPTSIEALFEAWDERCAIMEYDGGLSKEDAEYEAAKLYYLIPWLSELRNREPVDID